MKQTAIEELADCYKVAVGLDKMDIFIKGFPLLIEALLHKERKLQAKHEEELKAVIIAWEKLEGNNNYTPKQIERWLINDMKPMIDVLRKKTTNRNN